MSAVRIIARPAVLPVERYARPQKPIRYRICIDASGESLDERLRRMRRACGMSRLRLADASGVSPETIKNLEWRDGQPMASTVDALADALGVSMDDLWRGRKAS